MANEGLAPPDYTTDVGRFRLITGDTFYTPTAVDGIGDYTYLSDDEIEGYLELELSVYRAAGVAFMSLSATAARDAVSIKDFDLQVDAREKATQLRLAANWFFDQADAIDAEGEEGFSIVNTGRRETYAELAEGTWPLYDHRDYIQ